MGVLCQFPPAQDPVALIGACWFRYVLDMTPRAPNSSAADGAFDFDHSLAIPGMPPFSLRVYRGSTAYLRAHDVSVRLGAVPRREGLRAVLANLPERVCSLRVGVPRLLPVGILFFRRVQRHSDGFWRRLGPYDPIEYGTRYLRSRNLSFLLSSAN